MHPALIDIARDRRRSFSFRMKVRSAARSAIVPAASGSHDGHAVGRERPDLGRGDLRSLAEKYVAAGGNAPVKLYPGVKRLRRRPLVMRLTTTR